MRYMKFKFEYLLKTVTKYFYDMGIGLHLWHVPGWKYLWLDLYFCLANIDRNIVLVVHIHEQKEPMNFSDTENSPWPPSSPLFYTVNYSTVLQILGNMLTFGFCSNFFGIFGELNLASIW